MSKVAPTLILLLPRLVVQTLTNLWGYAARVYTISHAARLTGVPAATLRVWERRYGLVAPIRTDGGYRLYDERALQVVRAMSSLVAAGWAPRQAAAHLLSDEGGVAPDSPAGTPPTARTFESLAEGAAALDPVAVSSAMDEAFAQGSFEDVVDTWLMPSLQVVGAWWRDGRVDVAGEHVVSATVHRHLGAAMEATEHQPRGPLVAVGLARGSHHELGVLAFSVVLRRRGLGVVYLGTDLPAQDWVNVVRRRSPGAVVVGVPMRADVIAVRETADTLHAAAPGLAVYVGGGAQDEVGHGTVPLGHTIRAAADRLVSAMGPRQTTPAEPTR